MSIEKQLQAIVKERILILDGAMGTMIQKRQLEEADFRGERCKTRHKDLKGNNDLLVLTQPDVILDIHEQYLAAGADLIESNTFNATQMSMADYGMEAFAYEINLEAAKLARIACDKYSTTDKPRFVVGVIGPTSKTASISPDVNDPGFRNTSFDALVEGYLEALAGLIDGGADIIMVETIFDTLNAKAALFAVETIFEERGIRLPIMISGTITDASGRTFSGQTTEAFYNSLRHVRPFSIGLNCALGPDLLRNYVAEMSKISEFYLSAHANAGLPNAFGEYDLGALEMAKEMEEWTSSGFLNIVGGCCGTTPAHIAKMAEVVANIAPRVPEEKAKSLRLSGLEAVNLTVGESLFANVGE